MITINITEKNHKYCTFVFLFIYMVYYTPHQLLSPLINNSSYFSIKNANFFFSAYNLFAVYFNDNNNQKSIKKYLITIINLSYFAFIIVKINEIVTYFIMKRFFNFVIDFIANSCLNLFKFEINFIAAFNFLIKYHTQSSPLQYLLSSAKIIQV